MYSAAPRATTRSSTPSDSSPPSLSEASLVRRRRQTQASRAARKCAAGVGSAPIERAVAQPEHRVDLLRRHRRECLVDLWSAARFDSNQLEPQSSRGIVQDIRIAAPDRVERIEEHAHAPDARHRLLEQLQTLLALLTAGQGQAGDVPGRVSEVGNERRHGLLGDRRDDDRDRRGGGSNCPRGARCGRSRAHRAAPPRARLPGPAAARASLLAKRNSNVTFCPST